MTYHRNKELFGYLLSLVCDNIMNMKALWRKIALNYLVTKGQLIGNDDKLKRGPQAAAKPKQGRQRAVKLLSYA